LKERLDRAFRVAPVNVFSGAIPSTSSSQSAGGSTGAGGGGSISAKTIGSEVSTTVNGITATVITSSDRTTEVEASVSAQGQPQPRRPNQPARPDLHRAGHARHERQSCVEDERRDLDSLDRRHQCFDKVLRQTFGHVLRCVATSARLFRHMVRSPRVKLARFVEPLDIAIDISVLGILSAQYLNGRRRAMIFRLSGVALFQSRKLRDCFRPTRTSLPEKAAAASRSRCRLRGQEVLRQLVRRPTQIADTRSPHANRDIANSC